MSRSGQYSGGDRSSRGGGARFSEGTPVSRIKTEDVRKLVAEDDAKLLVVTAKAIGEQMAAERVTTNQVRNIFGAVRQLQLRWRSKDAPDAEAAFRQVMLLRPKIAYQAKRTANLANLKAALDEAIDTVGAETDKETRFVRFQRFVEFFEAILAYHAAAGGRQQ